MHPGDIQVVDIVENKRLMDKRNCVVFSQKGSRPLPNKLSGGDLDGDEFFVSINPSIIPKIVSQPMDFDTEKPIEKLEPVTMNDIADFIGEYITNDRLGQISNLHLACSDFHPEGVEHPDCIHLAKMASIAVDFPKTGISASHSRKIKLDTYPHFMYHRTKKSYISEKILGKLFDAVENPNLENDRILKYQVSQTGRVKADPRFLYPGWTNYLKLAINFFSQYAWDIESLIDRYRLQSEVECVTGTIVSWSRIENRSTGQKLGAVQGRKKFEVSSAVSQAMSEIISYYRMKMIQVTNINKSEPKIDIEAMDSKIDLENKENWKRASAWYFVAYADEEQRRIYKADWAEMEEECEIWQDDTYPMLSFPWIVGDILICILKSNINGKN
ncbi:hypothetical protein HK096_008009 [Nowakowskiella sp. JEL0078]|nr:hypothetical protein HK096_008009 [Nowakowskiella sp. JEL0078]